MSFILTDAEASAILSRFDTAEFGQLRDDKVLLSAILKLNRLIVSSNVRWVLRYANNHGSSGGKVELIKSVRALLGIGLKEAKDYVESSVNCRENGDVVVNPDQVVFGDNLTIARQQVNVTITEEVIS